jgi:hypothetical protein
MSKKKRNKPYGDYLETMKRMDELFNKINEHDNPPPPLCYKDPEMLTYIHDFRSFGDWAKDAVLATPFGKI